MGSCGILIEISGPVTLLQLMDSLGNVNCDISVVGYWIFESNYKRAFVLNIESLDLICDPSVGEEEFAGFETVFTAVGCIFSTTHLNK